ncbi:SSF1 [Candida pseudojiufengensis]|uniref:SSF1 n=1 Tax=Candida pseudojiufengensis TaxID=497109 RepID=UPI0022256BC3|nr:SSF1 [Candida pseudojiufengensis]KAI5959283.1 SSF1 [Candida pseudojiufengensis]
MAKRRTKRRTHKKVNEEEDAKIPKSMVIHLGSSLKNHSLSQLVSDFRNIMQPHTAINLRERKSNKLKDFIVMCGPLHVSDLFIFNQSSSGNITLRMGKLPRGPTLQFMINTYSLCKDVRRILKHPKSVGKDSFEFHQPPLLVMNGFSNNVKELSMHEKLMITMFQNMFPPIQPQFTKVNTIKRVLLINKNKETNEIEIRHYSINTKLVEENKNVKKLIQSHHNLKKKLPKLTNSQDVSDLILDPYSVGGITSDSEIEDDAVVEVQHEEILKKKQSEKPQEQESITTNKKRAIKLIELGPRINMSLVKIEEGLVGSSKTLYHSNISKTNDEIAKLDSKHKLKEQQKLERRAKQQAAVQAKLDKKKAKKDRKKARFADEDGNEDNEEGVVDDDGDEDEDEDMPEINAEDYENDSDLYSDVEV